MPRHRTRQFRFAGISPVVVLPVLTLLLAELALRVPAVIHHLPPARPYYDPGVESRLSRVHDLQRRGMGIDVLFLGSSVVRTNIDPTRFDALARDTTDARVSFNGGFSALHPDPVRLYLRHFWLPVTRPRLIAQAVRFEELRSGVLARTWYRFTGSRLERRWISRSPVSAEVASAVTHSRLLYYQGVVADWFSQGWSPEARERDFPVDARGFGPTELTLAQAVARGRIDSTAPVYTEGYADADFAVGLGALRESIELARDRGIPYVLVNMPEQCERFLGAPDGRVRYRAYLDALDALARDEQVPLVDVTHGDPATWCDRRWFSDYHHMSPAGAERFTRALALEMAAGRRSPPQWPGSLSRLGSER